MIWFILAGLLTVFVSWSFAENCSYLGFCRVTFTVSFLLLGFALGLLGNVVAMGIGSLLPYDLAESSSYPIYALANRSAQSGGMFVVRENGVYQFLRMRDGGYLLERIPANHIIIRECDSTPRIVSRRATFKTAWHYWVAFPPSSNFLKRVAYIPEGSIRFDFDIDTRR